VSLFHACRYQDSNVYYQNLFELDHIRVGRDAGVENFGDSRLFGSGAQVQHYWRLLMRQRKVRVRGHFVRRAVCQHRI
jgi:hypothetical protein